MKIDGQPNVASNAPPATGARIGARPITSISCENTLALVIGSQRSRTTARATTMPAQPPSACTKRTPISQSIDGAKALASDARVNRVTPTSSGPRRP